MRRYFGLILSLFFLCFSLTLQFFHVTGIESQSVSIGLNHQEYLVGRIYKPKTGDPLPVMVLCHGNYSSKENMEPFALELARRGIGSVVFDFGGFGESYSRPFSTKRNEVEARAVVRFVRSRPDLFDASRMGIGGHGMGGATARAVAESDSQLRVTISLGMSGPSSLKKPPNLFLGIGLYDRFNSEKFYPLRQMRSLMQRAIGQNPNRSKYSGDFTNKTALKVVISPTTDQSVEPYDPLLIVQAIAWIENAFDLPLSNQQLWLPWNILGGFFIFCSAIGVCVSLQFIQPNKQLFSTKLENRFLLILTCLLMFFYSIAGSNLFGEKLWISNLLLFLYVLHLVSNYANKLQKNFIPVLRVVVLYVAMLMMANGAIALLNGSALLFAHRAYLLFLPQFLLHLSVSLVYNSIDLIRNCLFTAYSLEVKYSLLFVILLAVELIQPGITIGWIGRNVVWIVWQWRSPLNLLKIWRFPKALISFLGILVVILIGILYQHWRYKLWSIEEARLVIPILIQFLLTVVLIFGILRSSTFQKLEWRCLKNFKKNSDRSAEVSRVN